MISLSDWIQVIAICVSLIVAIISIIQSNKSIKLSEQSIKDANRPYVVVYRDYIQVLSTVHEYLVIKNFGTTGATIDKIEFSTEYKDSMREKPVFGNISNTFIAPGQSISTVVSINAFKGERNGVIKATIHYHDSTEPYETECSLNEDFLHDLSLSKSNPTKSTSVQEVIIKASEEILRRNLWKVSFFF